MIDVYFNRTNHDPMCLYQFGVDENSCDCGATKERIKKDLVLNCKHQFSGFRTAKVCIHCGKTRAEIKEITAA
jgi:hypothetical protein